MAKIEAQRLAIPAGLRGKKLEEFIEKWVSENFDEKQKEGFGEFVSNRFKKGALAVPLEVLDALDKQQATVFRTEAEMKQWLDGQGWPEPLKAQIIAVGSVRVWSVDAASGKIAWETPLKKPRSIGASVLVSDGLVIVNADGVVAYDAATGEERWQQPRAGGGNSSPVLWTQKGTNLVVLNGSKELHALSAKDGAIVWSAPGGGDATPVIEGSTLVVQSNKKELGLVAYDMSASGATQRWSFPLEVRWNQSSPLIHAGAVYLMDDEFHSCFDLANGLQRWREPAPSNIASPVLADGKLFVMANNGNTLLVLAAAPNQRVELGKTTVRAQWIPSPCIAGDKLVLRLGEKLKSWSLAP